MITKIDQTTLQYYLPFTRDVKGSIIYKSYEQGLAMADEKLKNSLLGLTLYVMLSEAWSLEEQPENEALPDSDYRIGCTLDDLKNKVMEYICNEAAYLTLGHHNVMQSSVGGFTTATGSQEVVASQSRVNDLRDECRKTGRVGIWHTVADADWQHLHGVGDKKELQVDCSHGTLYMDSRTSAQVRR